MSTIVVVKKDGIAVIGADTMAKFGPTYQKAEYIKNYPKLLKVGESFLAYVGNAAFGNIIPSYFAKLKTAPVFNSAQSIFEEFLKFHGALKEDYFLRPVEEDDDDFESLRTEILIANQFGIFGVYDLRSVDEFNKFYSFGSGYKFALGAMKTLYDTTATAEEIAQAGLEAAAEFDDGTGKPLEIRNLACF